MARTTKKQIVHKPTIAWVDAMVARKKASGSKRNELKTYRDALIAKHGLA